MAWAGDKLAIAPAPDWVAAVSAAADDGKGDGAPVKLLLRDEQVDLQPGKLGRYMENVFKVQTPQGLQAGAVSLSWNPDTQTATVHKLKIRRDGKEIDVLAGQSFTVMRRETNLENAVLDGVLTASIQPEGLQVGDVVDFAVTITTSDPVVGHHVEDAGASWNGLPVARGHLRARWPATVALRIQPSGGLSMPKVIRKGGEAGFEILQDGIEPVTAPNGAPLRYQFGRLIELSDFASWGDIAALMAPLYAKAEALPAGSPLQAEIGRIKAASPDPKARAEAALALVQDRVRYVFLGMNDGGLVPADAATTWSRRFGDCKGKTALLLALLHALGIEAQPVLVNSRLGDGLDRRLPSVGLFDHIIVRAVVAGRTYWLDGTRTGDTVLDGIETPFFRWGLPLAAGSKSLVPIMPAPLARPQTDVAIRIDASGGISLPAPIHIERVVRGDEAVADKIALGTFVGADRDRVLREFWKQRYDFAEPKTVSASFDPKSRTMTMVLDGTTRMDWNDGWYEADHVWVGYKADFSRDPRADKNAPFAVGFPSYTHVVETVLLPPGSTGYTISKNAEVDEAVAGIAYRRHATIDGARFTVEQSDRSLAPEFPAADAPAAETRLRALAKTSVFLNRPSNYVTTAAERDAIIAGKPTTAAGLVDQGNALINEGRYDEAIIALSKAIALNPKAAHVYANRAVAETWKNDIVAAKADLAMAEKIDPNDFVIFHIRGMLADRTGRAEDAIAAYTRAMELSRNDVFAMTARASAEYRAGRIDAALADSKAALAIAPKQPNIYLLRANIWEAKGDRANVGKEADELLAHAPDEVYAQVVAARIYARIGRDADAMKALDAALRIKPEAYIYLNRADIRPKEERAARLVDVDAAMKLEPGMVEVYQAKAAILFDDKDWHGAVATLTTGLNAKPGDASLLSDRGIAYAKLGDQAHAEADFTAARSKVTNWDDLNNLCYAKAMAGVALERALGECDGALAQSPDQSPVRDSRAFVLLRLGRLDESIAEYGRVLAAAPGTSVSLYGRALAEQRKGDAAAAKLDADAALAVDPKVAKRFESYGLTMAGG